MEQLTRWTDSYRPDDIEDLILPEHIKEKCRKMIEIGNCTNMIFTGEAGVGKTSLAIVLAKSMKADYIIFDGSTGELSLDAIRERVMEFSTTMSLDASAPIKFIIIDECDGLSKEKQRALRRSMEKYEAVRFILTCNYPERLLKAMRSRCATIDFDFDIGEQEKMVGQYCRCIAKILTDRGIEFQPQVLIDLCKKYLPDNRRIMNEVQVMAEFYGNLNQLHESPFGDVGDLYAALQNKSFGDVKQWVHNNSTTRIYNELYKTMETYLETSQVPTFILCLAEAQKYDDVVPNRELNLLAALTEFMSHD